MEEEKKTNDYDNLLEIIDKLNKINKDILDSLNQQCEEKKKEIKDIKEKEKEEEKKIEIKDILTKILYLKKNKNETKDTALFMASVHGQTEIVKLLIEKVLM